MTRPAATEFAPFYAAYVARVPETDPLPALEAQPTELLGIADRIAPEDELFRYAPDKWSVRQLFGHLIDTERVMGYRAFCIARGEVKALPGFDEKEYVSNADSEDHPVKELAHEFAAVRHANLWRSAAGQTSTGAVPGRPTGNLTDGPSLHHAGNAASRGNTEGKNTEEVKGKGKISLHEVYTSSLWWPLMSPATSIGRAAFYTTLLTTRSHPIETVWSWHAAAINACQKRSLRKWCWDGSTASRDDRGINHTWSTFGDMARYRLPHQIERWSCTTGLLNDDRVGSAPAITRRFAQCKQGGVAVVLP